MIPCTKVELKKFEKNNLYARHEIDTIFIRNARKSEHLLGYVVSPAEKLVASLPSHQRWHTLFLKRNKEDYLSLSLSLSLVAALTAAATYVLFHAITTSQAGCNADGRN
jgi:hypothetical protein